jgi:hypothetical protein
MKSNEAFVNLLERFGGDQCRPVIDEFELAWGEELFKEIQHEARQIRVRSWENAKLDNPNIKEIDFEPSVELVLAVAIRKLLRVSMYNNRPESTLNHRLEP